MVAICSSKTSVENQQTTRRHIPEDDTLHNHRYGNLKSYINWSVPVVLYFTFERLLFHSGNSQLLVTWTQWCDGICLWCTEIAHQFEFTLQNRNQKDSILPMTQTS
jgi:hypothetical protein